VAAQIESAVPQRVALLGRDDEVRAQLRAALSDAGADIVHEGDAAQADVAALGRGGIDTLIINLDAGLEEAIERLDALIENPQIQVVFNESEVTQRLSGWDLARWARHLVAKVLRSDDTTPPPPPGAEPLPLRDLQPEPLVRPTQVDSGDDRGAFEHIADEARRSVAEVPASRMPQREAEPDPLPPAAQDDALVAVELEHAAPEPDFELAAVAIEKPMPETASAQYLDPGEVLEIDDFELVPHHELEGGARRLGADEPTVVLSRDELHAQLAVSDAVDPGPSASGNRRGSDDPTLELDLADIEAGLEALADESDGVEVAPASSVYVETGDDAEPGDLDIDAFEGLADLGEAAGARLPSSADEAEIDLSLDEDVAALAAQLDALGDDANTHQPLIDDPQLVADAAGGFGIGFEVPETEPEVDTPAAAPAADGKDAAGVGFGELSLLDLDAELEAPAAERPAPLANQDFDLSGLSLAPIEGEDAAAQGAEAASQAGQILRVVVLGASIGGPDALRSFLAAIPTSFPALFVLVQHLENGFFSRLAQQLQKSTGLTLRVADESVTQARMGEVLVLPSDARYRIRRDGSLLRESYAEPPRYKPCIDDAFRAVADEFARDTVAIIFSGMAGDAVEGASHVTAMGGEVWGQDPQSCVVSSMIDGAQARGLLEAVGSPRELAEKLVARFAGA
jgi:two-component system chemotaxis response regulator CheB/chemosensory pili system protein ChpB (putative protein-glutamate methylesterase)